MPILAVGVASLFFTGYTEDSATGQMSSLSLSLGDTPHLATAGAVFHFHSLLAHSLSFSLLSHSLSHSGTADEKSWHFGRKINRCLGAPRCVGQLQQLSTHLIRAWAQRGAPEKMWTKPKLKPSSLRVLLWSECTQCIAWFATHSGVFISLINCINRIWIDKKLLKQAKMYSYVIHIHLSHRQSIQKYI